jgi:hypothetical protein
VVEPLYDVEIMAVLPPGSTGPTGPAGSTGPAEPAGSAGSAGAAPIGIGDLADVPLVAGAPGTAWRELTDGLFGEAGVSPTIAVESVYREAVGPLILSGGLAAVMPAALAPAGAIVRPFTRPVRRTLALLRRPGPLPPAAAAFLQVAQLPPPQAQEEPGVEPSEQRPADQPG